MIPKKTTVENEREQERKAACDQLITGAAKIMVHQVGASLPLMLDRLLTFAAAQACAAEGPAKAASKFRDLAARIEAGALDGKGMH